MTPTTPIARQPERRAVRAEDVAAIVTATDVALSPDGRLVAYTRTEVDLDHDGYRSAVYLVPADGGEPKRLTQGRGRDWAPNWSPDGRWLAFLSDRDGLPAQLYLLPVSGGEPYRLTSLTGGAGPAAWSPDGTRLAFCARASKDDPPTDPAARDRWTARPRVVTRGPYKSDGSRYAFDAVSHVFVAALGSGTVAQITTAEADHWGPAWSPDGRYLAYVRERTGAMDFRLSDLWVCHADGSHARRLSDAAGRALGPSWSPDGRTIVFYASAPGDIGDVIMGVWIVVPGSSPARPLTPAYDRSIALARQPEATPPPAWSPDGSTLLVSVADSGCVHIARISVADGSVNTVVGGARQIQSLSVASDRLAFAATDWQTPADIHVCGRDGAHEHRLTDLNGTWLSGVALPRIEHRQFDSPHGGTLDGWVIHPAEEERRPAPLLLEIHGGPHNSHGNAFPGGALHMFLLACRGWTVLALNPTGSGSFGKAFAYALRGRWGEHDLPEHLAAVDALVREGVADPARLAVSGYSYGGFMAAWTTSHTDRFKAAIVGAPIVNAESFYGTSDIGAWFGPWEAGGDVVGHREVFRRLSPIHYVERVTTPTLVVHGEADDRCPIGQGEEWYIGLLAAERAPVEFVRYPGQSHGFRGTGRPSHRIDVVRRMSDWVERYTLKHR